MGDFGKGIKSFKQGMADETDKPAAPPQARIPAQSADPVTPAATEASKSEQP
jgi:sec-independent protein translocase protein TatA